MLAMAKPGNSGMTAHVARAGTIESNGAMTKRNRFALEGITTSLTSSLITSANGWNHPRGPTRFGPIRFCM